jgi:hypothetical protein
MDINELQTSDSHEKGAELRVKNPVTGKDTDFYIKLMGVDSPAYQKALVRVKHDAIRKYAAKDETVNEQDEIDGEIESLVAVTLGWRGLSDNGKEVKFSESQCRKFYLKAPKIRQQVLMFIGNAENFTKG